MLCNDFVCFGVDGFSHCLGVFFQDIHCQDMECALLQGYSDLPHQIKEEMEVVYRHQPGAKDFISIQ